MQTYLLRRVLLSVPALLGVTVLIFLAMRVLPGDPLAMITGGAEGGRIYFLSDAELAAARASLGLDRPLHEQYLSWMADVLGGRMGTSFWRDEPIAELIIRRGPISVEIALLALLLSWVVGVPVGVVSALWRNSAVDYLSRVLVILFVAVPHFWVALIIVMVEVLFFQWQAPLAIVYPWDDLSSNLQIVAGPAFVLGLGVAAATARMARSATLEVIHEDFVRTAHAKGLRQGAVDFGHVLRNALLPVVTVSGLHLGGLLGGAVAVERAFNVPGLGTALVSALGERDWMTIQNLVLVYGVFHALVNLLVDLSYGFLDPRIRYQ